MARRHAIFVAAVASFVALDDVAVTADVVAEFEELYNFVDAAGCLPYFETYFGWNSTLFGPSATVRPSLLLANSLGTSRTHGFFLFHWLVCWF